MDQDRPLDKKPVGDQQSAAEMVGRGILAGLAGTVVMTAFQKLVEMPHRARRQLCARRLCREGATHLALGTLWGAAYGLAAHKGLRGQQAVAAVFATVYIGDVGLNTALGLYQPLTWSGRDWAIDIGDKLVQAEATGAIFDHLLAPPDRSTLPAGG